MNLMSERSRVALDAIRRRPVNGVPIGVFHIMEHQIIERLAGDLSGTYRKDPYGTYIRMLQAVGVNLVDQMLMENPLTMGDKGYESDSYVMINKGQPTLNGILIDSPEACVEHIESFEIPRIKQCIAAFNRNNVIQQTICQESFCQQLLGPDILKAGYGQLTFPHLLYTKYGYEPFFMAYALYPEVMDHLFACQTELSVLNNDAVVSAYNQAGLPLYHRLDHDMADSRGLLVSLASLRRNWLPGFFQSIKPAVDAGFALLWHCDGNLMDLIPELIDCGVNGFQGFQYEDGMDYIQICRMKAKDGQSLVIQAGISVTRELPMGKPEDVKKQIAFLVENGPENGLFLSFSSSCAPGTPWINIQTAIEGMKYYQKHR